MIYSFLGVKSVHVLVEFCCSCQHVSILSSDIYCCGLLSTRKSDCTGLPQSMLVCGSTPAQRGQSRVMMKGNMSLISWYNKGHFRFLTNSYPPTKQGNRCPDAPTTKTHKTNISETLKTQSVYEFVAFMQVYN